MPYTGLFLLKELSANWEKRNGKVFTVERVQAICLTCEHLIDAQGPPDLERLSGSVMLYCSQCGTRQVVTNEHFQNFLERVAGKLG